MDSTRRPPQLQARRGRSAALVLLLGLGGCSIAGHSLPSAEELAIFEAAGPIQPEVDVSVLVRGISQPGPYRVIAGDLLEIEAPPNVLSIANDQSLARADRGHLARVEQDGALYLPVAGRIEVAGRTLPEIESIIINAFYPKFVTRRPAIVGRVAEYSRKRVVVIGAVEKPGVQDLRHDQLTLMGALTEAGGIVKTGGNLIVGARLIKIHSPHAAQEPVQPIVLPVKGLNVPFADVPLQGGETIEVERYEPDRFSVVGLVNKPGSYDYPPEVQYNLMQAVAFAGGVDRIAAPPYASIFRKDKDGKIVSATFEISGDGLVRASGTVIKPGDVIALQHTFGSWTRSLLHEILRVQFGFFVDQRSL